MKIAIVAKPQESAVTYYRANAVFEELCRVNGWAITVAPPESFSDDTMHRFDVVFLHRPQTEKEIEVIWKAKQIGVKSWVDIDDLLWKMPLVNPNDVNFGPAARFGLTTAFVNADAISCSTQFLAEAILTEYNRHAVVIPNAWNDRAGETQTFNPAAKQKDVFWRGSNTHDGDLYKHRGAFRPYKKIRFLFMGSKPWYFHKQYGGYLPFLNYEKWTPGVLGYFARIREINPAFFIVPLEDSPFNRAKSNIAAIEATDAGAVTIYPSYLPEFAKFPGIPYDDPAHLRAILKEIDKAPVSSFAHVHEAAREYVYDNLRLSEVNNLRKEIVEQLTTAPVWL